ncbi:hypothetical protein E2C01_033500 [Portunus trituberculatus]|uniref:Uncharacterized protein n=1 Tax=Portunus trituberculatus TaxID=210409 RepID=A0A5B7F331_PORTR|nr:hypothetical protein [Portunus trituberculatus]
MNPLMVCSSQSYSASTSVKKSFTAEYHITTWTMRPTISDGSTIRHFLGTAEVDCIGRVVLRAK